MGLFLSVLVPFSRSLLLQGDAGSVTPGVLTSLLPAIANITSFGLSVAYSVKYDELLPFLGELKHLQRLKLFHYPVNQYHPFSSVPIIITYGQQVYPVKFDIPPLSSLASLEIIHAHTNVRAHVQNMYVWIRRIVLSSPLSYLRISCEEPLDECPRDAGHGISYDGLVDHLVSKHRSTLMELRMPCAYVGKERLAALVDEQKFPYLEDLELRVRESSLVSQFRLQRNLC